MKRNFELLEHTADAYIEAYGDDLAEAFENAALAMFEVMTDTTKVNPIVEEEVEVEGEDECSLLYNWLEALLVKFEVDGNLYSRFEVEEIERTDVGLRLRASVAGEPFDPNEHVQRAGVKAVTYHRMEVLKGPEGAVVRFILDL